MSTIGVKAIKYPDGDSAINITDGGNVTLAGTLNVTGAFTSQGIDDNADATAITINSSEQVGIGISPTVKLQIEESSTGDAVKIARGGNYLLIGGSGSGTQYVKGYEGTVAFGNKFSGNTTFLTSDTERMRINSSGNVGIGTTSPASPSGFGNGGILHLKGAANNDCSIVLEGLYSSGGRQEIGVSSGDLYFNRGAATGSMSTSMVIKSSGNVGIGTTSPSLSTASGSANGLEIKGTVPALNLKESSGNDEFLLYGGASSATIYTVNNLRFLMSGSEKMRISTAGNVGIGTTSPAYQLTLSGNSTYWEAGFQTTVDGGNQTLKIISDAHGGGGRTGDIRFYTNSASSERMRIDSSGNVGIGTASPSSFGVHTDNLVIGTTSGENGMTIASGTANSGRIQFADNTASPFRGAIEYAHGSSDALIFYTAGSERFRINSNGRINAGTGIDVNTGFRFFSPSGQTNKVAEFAVQNGTGCHLPVNSTAFTASSDETLKENITEFDKQTSYDNIKNMRAVTFNYKDWTLDGTTYQDDKKRIGFIAQDWETNYPEIIDKDQNDKLCMKYTETIPVLLSALQKAQEKIETLEAEVKTLKG